VGAGEIEAINKFGAAAGNARRARKITLSPVRRRLYLSYGYACVPQREREREKTKFRVRNIYSRRWEIAREVNLCIGRRDMCGFAFEFICALAAARKITVSLPLSLDLLSISAPSDDNFQVKISFAYFYNHIGCRILMRWLRIKL
jgi:hypothetical protein